MARADCSAGPLTSLPSPSPSPSLCACACGQTVCPRVVCNPFPVPHRAPGRDTSVLVRRSAFISAQKRARYGSLASLEKVYEVREAQGDLVAAPPELPEGFSAGNDAAGLRPSPVRSPDGARPAPAPSMAGKKCTCFSCE